MIGVVLRADVICDELWAVIEPVLPSGAGRRGRPWNDHRVTLEAIAWRFRTGSPWRDLPADFGAWQSIWERHRRWSTDGTYAAMFAAVRAAAPAAADQLEELISVDSTSVRVHQHAAGAQFHADFEHDPSHTGGRIELQESAR
jgi:putative transposase